MAIAIDMARLPTTVTNIVTASQPPPTDNIRSKADKTKTKVAIFAAISKT